MERLAGFALAVAAAVTVLASSAVAHACPWCRPLVEQQVFDPAFTERLGITLAPFAVFAVIAIAIHRVEWKRARRATRAR